MDLRAADMRLNYTLAGLNEVDLDPDPFQQFAIWFQQAREAGVPEANAMVLATASSDGVPAARVVLLKDVDERGIVWPDSIAPFTVVLCPIGYDRSAEVKAAADQLHEQLQAVGIDVMLDDRGERPGAMFADWELIGVPHRVVISDRGLKEGQLEYQGRQDTAATKLAPADVLAHLKQRLGLPG